MPAKHYAITRIKAAKNAWRWVVHIGRGGKIYSKSFPDRKLGGKGVALDAALKWRDETARKNLLTFREFHAQKRSNNTSGIPGVHRVVLPAQPMGSWQAKIKLPDGRKITKTFAILKFGEKEAFDRAVAARKVMLDSLGDRLYLKSATAKRLVREVPSSTAKRAQNRLAGRHKRSEKSLSVWQKTAAFHTVSRGDADGVTEVLRRSRDDGYF